MTSRVGKVICQRILAPMAVLLMPITLFAMIAVLLKWGPTGSTPENASFRRGLKYSEAIVPIKINDASMNDDNLRSSFVLSRTYDGNEQLNDEDCFYSKFYKGWALYDTSWALFTQIRLQSTPTNLFYMQGTLIEICDQGGNCSVCGVFKNIYTTADFQQIYCNLGYGIEGNQVKITNPSNLLQFCEVNFNGKELIEDAVRKQDVVRAVSFRPENIYADLDPSLAHTLDGILNTIKAECYSSPEGSTVLVFFPFSRVTHVSLLNAHDPLKEMEGIMVDICVYGSSCYPCGVISHLKSGDWVTVYCFGGYILGNMVKLRNTLNPSVFFCEINVFGAKKGADVGVLLKSRIKWTESSKIHKSVNPDLTATYNDPWTNNYLSCFLSSNYDTNWIVYGIDGWSHLHYVNLLNSDSQLYAENMNGTIVEICDVNQEHCAYCGRAPPTPVNSWATVFCEEKVEGQLVKLHQPHGQLHFCDIEIYHEIILTE